MGLLIYLTSTHCLSTGLWERAPMCASTRLVGLQVNDHTGLHGLHACTCDIQGPQCDLEGSYLSGPLIQLLLSYLSLWAHLQVGTCRSPQGLWACWSIATLIHTSLWAFIYGVHYLLSSNGPAPEFYLLCFIFHCCRPTHSYVLKHPCKLCGPTHS